MNVTKMKNRDLASLIKERNTQRVLTIKYDEMYDIEYQKYLGHSFIDENDMWVPEDSEEFKIFKPGEVDAQLKKMKN